MRETIKKKKKRNPPHPSQPPSALELTSKFVHLTFAEHFQRVGRTVPAFVKGTAENALQHRNA